MRASSVMSTNDSDHTLSVRCLSSGCFEPPARATVSDAMVGLADGESQERTSPAGVQTDGRPVRSLGHEEDGERDEARERATKRGL